MQHIASPGVELLRNMSHGSDNTCIVRPLQALLLSYLQESGDVLSTHCLVLYLLLDLVSVDNSDDNEVVSIITPVI